MVEVRVEPNDVVFDELSAPDLDLQDESKSKWPTTFWTQYTTLTQRQFQISKSNIFNKFIFIKYTALIVYAAFAWWRIPRIEERLEDKFALVSKTGTFLFHSDVDS